MNEIEVKYKLVFLPKIKKTMDNCGFVFKEKHFERNFIFDTQEHEFKNANKLLRLRLFTKDLIKIKGLFTTKIKTLGEYKSNIETEIEINQPHIMLQMLKTLFAKHFEYQKFRSVYYSKQYKITACIDELPIGTFLELESTNETNLKEVIDLLKLKSIKPIIQGYPTLCGDKNQCYSFDYVKKAFGKKDINTDFIWD